VDSLQLLEALLDLARDVGLSVRPIGSAAGGDAPAAPSSGVCRVRGEVWVLLADSDPVERRVEVLAHALRTCAGDALEARFLPPAVRARLEP
jgi:hypothetical protein